MSKEQGLSHKERVGFSGPISLFDVDGTLANGFAILAFAGQLSNDGLLSSQDFAKMQEDFLNYKSSQQTADLYHSFAVDIVDHYAIGLRGKKVSVIQEASEKIFDKVLRGEIEDYLIMPFTRELITLMSRFGPTLALSGSPIDFLKPLEKRLGMNAVFGTSFKQENGYYTGEVDVNLALGISKNQQVESIIQSGNVDVQHSFAFGDQMSDIPLLEKVSNPFVLGSNSELQNYGIERGWVVAFSENDVIPLVKQRIYQVFGEKL